MFLRRFQRVARRYLDAGISLQLYSSPGVGKSESVAQLVERCSEQDGFEWGLVTCMLATYTPSDLLGYLVPADREIEGPDGVVRTTRVSEFTLPPWMMSDKGKPINSYKRGVIFFDEYDKADPDVKRASAEIILNGHVGPWQLHDGIGVIAAANRKEDRSGSTKDFDFVINRRGEIHIQADIASWEDWAVRNNVDPLFVAFAKRNVDVVFGSHVPEKQGPFCTPRSFVMLSKLLEAYRDDHGHINLLSRDDEADALEMSSGLVGAAAANTFLTWIKMRTEVPDFEEIVKDPTGTAVPTKPDGKMIVAYDIAHRVDEKTIDPVITYALRLPSEFQITFGLAAMKRNHRLISTSAMQKKFIPKNTQLINLLSAG